MTKRYWQSAAPLNCDACPASITNTFYDMKTQGGPWGSLCPYCAMHGIGVGMLGTGSGQKYEKQGDGKWLKTGG